MSRLQHWLDDTDNQLLFCCLVFISLVFIGLVYNEVDKLEPIQHLEFLLRKEYN